MIDTRGFSYILYRVKLVKDLLDSGVTNVAWVDTDVIVRSDLSDFLEIGKSSLKILYRGRYAKPDSKFNAGIFNLSNSKATREMVYEWYDRISSNSVWGMGQLELWNSYLNHKDDVHLDKLLTKFNDLGGRDKPNAFSDNSVMWHCKKNHFDNPRFQKEFLFYLNIVDHLF